MSSAEFPSSSIQTDPPSIKLWEKVKTFPRVNEEYQNFRIRYEKVKQHHWKLGYCLSAAEFVLLQVFHVLTSISSSETPFVCWFNGYGKKLFVFTLLLSKTRKQTFLRHT